MQEPVFIAFRFGPVFTVATPVDVPYRWAWQSLAEPRVCGEDAIRSWVYNMVDATYRIVDDPLEGLVVEGRISTPQTLITDPHDIVLKATVFPMAVVAPRVESIGAAEAAFEAHGVEIKSLRRDAESGTKTSMVTVPVWNLSKSAEIWASVSVQTPPRPPSTEVQPPGLDDEIDELLDP